MNKPINKKLRKGFKIIPFVGSKVSFLVDRDLQRHEKPHLNKKNCGGAGEFTGVKMKGSLTQKNNLFISGSLYRSIDETVITKPKKQGAIQLN